MGGIWRIINLWMSVRKCDREVLRDLNGPSIAFSHRHPHFGGSPGPRVPTIQFSREASPSTQFFAQIGASEGHECGCSGENTMGGCVRTLTDPPSHFCRDIHSFGGSQGRGCSPYNLVGK